MEKKQAQSLMSSSFRAWGSGPGLEKGVQALGGHTSLVLGPLALWEGPSQRMASMGPSKLGGWDWSSSC